METYVLICGVMATAMAMTNVCPAEMKTWDGRHSIDEIELTVVYFVPRDRSLLLRFERLRRCDKPIGFTADGDS